MNESLKFFWDNVISDVPKPQQERERIFNWVDVRDLADAHILAMENDAAGGQRFLVTCESYVWQDWSAWQLCFQGQQSRNPTNKPAS
jgi:hypothetical protein